MTTTLAIAERFGGPIHLESDGAGVEALVIRDDAAYDALIARLPELRVQQRQPAPLSSDPLRARPAIDVARQMLVVVTRSGSLTPPLLARVLAEPERVIVRFAVDAPPPEARPFGIGGYAAALVPRAEGPVDLVGPRVIDDEAALAAAVGDLVRLEGTLSATKLPTLVGVDVDQGHASADQPAVATGWLEREVVTEEEIDGRTAEDGPYAQRGAGTFYRLLDPYGLGLAQAHRRW